jgi:hypothetical protein
MEKINKKQMEGNLLPWEEIINLRNIQIYWNQYPTHPEVHTIRKLPWEGLITIRFEAVSYAKDTPEAQSRRDNFVELVMKNIIRHSWKVRLSDVLWVSATEFGNSGIGHCHVAFNFLPLMKKGKLIPDLENFEKVSREAAAYIAGRLGLRTSSIDVDWIKKYDDLGLATYIAKKESGQDYKHFVWSADCDDWIDDLLEEEETAITEESRIHIDKLGHKVKVPHGYKYREGPDGNGVAVPPGAKTVTDMQGRLHAVPIGSRAVENLDGTIQVVKFGHLPRTHENRRPPAFG